jgi:hypothetical protein
MYYPEIARQRWAGRTIHNDGRYALVRAADVWLFDSWQQAKSAASRCPDVEMVDLTPPPVLDLPDDWEDKQWSRNWERKQAR